MHFDPFNLPDLFKFEQRPAFKYLIHFLNQIFNESKAKVSNFDPFQQIILKTDHMKSLCLIFENMHESRLLIGWFISDGRKIASPT